VQQFHGVSEIFLISEDQNILYASNSCGGGRSIHFQGPLKGFDSAASEVGDGFGYSVESAYADSGFEALGVLPQIQALLALATDTSGLIFLLQ
jgi:hypothetical protein